MTLDKLQKIATTHVDAKYKAKWLKWWNSSPMSREALRFLSSTAKDIEFDAWLVKTSFWAQVVLLISHIHCHFLFIVCDFYLLNYVALKLIFEY